MPRAIVTVRQRPNSHEHIHVVLKSVPGRPTASTYASYACNWPGGFDPDRAVTTTRHWSPHKLRRRRSWRSRTPMEGSLMCANMVVVYVQVGNLLAAEGASSKFVHTHHRAPTADSTASAIAGGPRVIQLVLTGLGSRCTILASTHTHTINAARDILG